MVAVGRVEEPLINYLIPTQTVNRCLSVLSVDSLFLCPTRTFRFRCPLSKRRHPRTSGWTWSYPPVDDLVRRKGWSQSLSLSSHIVPKFLWLALSGSLGTTERTLEGWNLCTLHNLFFIPTHNSSCFQRTTLFLFIMKHSTLFIGTELSIRAYEIWPAFILYVKSFSKHYQTVNTFSF